VALSLNSFKAGFRYDFIWRTLIFLVALRMRKTRRKKPSTWRMTSFSPAH
jgi:hypothetical protein